MTKLTISETARFLLERDHFAIVTHRRPDGDTLGCAALLCLGLRQLGKTAWVLHNPEVTEKYLPLLAGLTKASLDAQDTLVAVDVASGNMLGGQFDCIKDKILLRIDHHGSATSFTEFELVDPDAAACGEVIYDVLREMGAKLDMPMATALYTAVSTDTGCFRYANTTANTLRVAADCVAAGADTFTMNQMYFETNSLGRLRLQGWLVENALFLQEGKVVICALPLAKEQELGLTEDDLENISGFPRSIAGVKIAATLRQEPDGKIKMSVRAVPGCDAAAICQKFGGGGHKGAAGASMDMTMEEAVEAVKAAISRPYIGVYQNMNGIVIIDKPSGWTSQDVTAKLRGVFQTRRIGHGGTLDPMATGVLPVFVGRATRGVEFFEHAEKTYETVLRLGITTDTEDITGTVLTEQDAFVTGEQLEQVLEKFRGEIMQVPPMYSALKINGQKLCDLARKGKEVERKPRPVTIHQLTVLSMEAEGIRLRVRCSKGTYIRTLCKDIGEALGCGGCMASLRRVSAGAYTIHEAVPLSELIEADDPQKYLRGVDTMFAEHPAVTLTEKQTLRCRNGNSFSVDLPEGTYRAYSQSGEFLMLAKVEFGIMSTTKSFFEV